MLSLKLKVSYGIGAFGKDLACAIIYTFLMYYLTDVIGLVPAFVGTLFLVARLWDAINDPMMGMIVDNTRSKWGKFRPWILIGSLLNAFVIVAMFFKPDGLEGKMLYVYISIMYILWGMTYTIMDIPFWSMIPALTSNKKEREEIVVIPKIFALVAWLGLGSFGLPIIGMLGKGNEIKGFRILSIIISVIFFITAIITFLYVKENKISNDKTPKVNLKDTFRLITKNDQLVALLSAVLVYNLVGQISGGVSIYYFKYIVGKENLFGVFTGFSLIAQIVALTAFPMLSSKIGRKKVFFFACILPVLGYGLLYITGIIAPQNAIFVALAGIIGKIGSGMSMGLSTVMFADVVDYGEYKFGTRNESVIFSVQTLLVKSSSAVSGWAIGVGLSLVGYVANAQQTPMALLGIKSFMIFCPMIFSMLGYVIYKKYYKLHDEYYDEIIKELESRKNK